MRKSWWVFLLLFIFAQGAMAAPAQLIMNQQDTGSMIRLERDTVAVIELETNPSTGYFWQAELPENDCLQILGRQFVPSKPGMLGASGIEKIYVAGTREGQAPLAFSLKRGDAPDKAQKQLTFEFVSEGKLQESFEMPELEDTADTQIDEADAMPETETDATLLGLPRSFNWCNRNGCTPIRNQGSCGSCWAFSTVSTFESLLRIQTGRSRNLSEQYLVSCNSNGWGCNGGWFAHDYHWWKKVSGENQAGAVNESTKPYTARDTRCNPPNAKTARLSGWSYVGSSGGVPSTSAIKNAIYNHGPVAAAVCSNSAMGSYRGGVFSGPSCSGVNHAINIVGWNDDGGYWIMRNSWGTGWGENGYMRIKYGTSRIGYAANYARY